VAAGEVRVPCPQCGGLVHPVAGRCKHCKANLSTGRSSATAPTALPALGAAPARPPIEGTAAVTRGADEAATAPRLGARPAPVAPVLPPAPVPRGGRAGGWSQQWPIVVIVVAVCAIVAAIAIMVWPEHHADPGATTRGGLPPPPAPERMDTDPSATAPTAPGNPTPPPATAPPGITPPSNDPWSSRGGPSTSPPVPIPRAPDVDPADPSDPGDPLPSLKDLPLGASSFSTMAVEKLCTRLTTCQQLDSSVCALFSAGGATAPPANCPAAQQCLDAIDHLDCNGRQFDTAALMTLFFNMKSCADALRC
jgi:hypothetical protein